MTLAQQLLQVQPALALQLFILVGCNSTEIYTALLHKLTIPEKNRNSTLSTKYQRIHVESSVVGNYQEPHQSISTSGQNTKARYPAFSQVGGQQAALTLLHSERPKLSAILAFLSATGLNKSRYKRQISSLLASKFLFCHNPVKLLFYHRHFLENKETKAVK